MKTSPGHHRKIRQKASGFILPLVIMGIVSVAFFVTFVNYMSQGFSTQVEHLDEFSRAQSAAEGLLAKVQARLHTQRWRDRFFSPTPHYATGSTDDGGAYELYVIDTPGRQYEMDVYAQVRYKRANRLFFWRLRHEISILDAAGRNFPIIFTMSEPQPLNKGNSPLDDKIKKILDTRKKNKPKAIEKSSAIKTSGSLKDIVAILDGPQDAEILDENTQGTELPPSTDLTPPPGVPATTVFEENFDALPAGDQLIPGFTQVGNDFDGRKGAVVKTRNSSPQGSIGQSAGCYEFEDSTNQYIRINPGNRLVYEFDHHIGKPGTGELSPLKTYRIGPVYSLSARNRLMFNAIEFRASDKKVYFTSDIYSFVPSQSSYLCEWRIDRFTGFKVDLDFDSQTADVYVNGSRVLERFPIKPKTVNSVDPDTGEMVEANLEYFEVHGHGYPYQSSLDNLRLAR